MSNLEYTPRRSLELAEKDPMWNWIATKVMGTYFVNVSQFKDRSRAPGVWSKIWQQIPMTGEAHAVRKEVERRAVLASNRSIPVSREGKGVSRKPLEKQTAGR
jgi:hypothetical protein